MWFTSTIKREIKERPEWLVMRDHHEGLGFFVVIFDDITSLLVVRFGRVR